MYLFVADESGNLGITSGTSSSYSLGGYVIKEADLPHATSIWKKVKVALGSSAGKEIKWEHFFVEENPLGLNFNQAAKRTVAAYILKNLFEAIDLLPLVAVVKKDKADDDLIGRSRKGNPKLKEDLFLSGLLAMFAGFLGRKEARGRVIFDSAGTTKDMERQQILSDQIQSLHSGKLPNHIMKDLENLLLIEEKISFMDSKNSEFLQLADFFCGVIWRVAEGDEALMGIFDDEFGRRAEKEGLGLLHLL